MARRREATVERLAEIYGGGARPTLAERPLDALVAGEAVDVRMPMAAIDTADAWTMPMVELATLAAICVRARPRRIFEIGTYTNHTYDFVRVDSEHALAMLRPGGLIVWDDYVWTERAPECAGVTRRVNELAVTRPVRRIAGTRLALLVDDRPSRP